jgi:hypothetical protein
MERVVRVNASRGSNDAEGTRTRQSAASDQRSGLVWEAPGAATRSTAESEQGPCLYFGPAGQRCSRPALAGGFCSRHSPDARTDAATTTISPRKLIAILAAAVALWPILADVIRAILRFIR